MRGRPWILVLLAALLLGGCAAVPGPPAGAERVWESHLLPGTEDTPLAGVARQWAQSAAAGESTLHPLTQGIDALAARLLLVDEARKGLDVQYYIFRADASGEVLAEAVWRAAERGVRVRLLLDDWGARPADDRLRALARHPRIQVRLFNPLSVRGWPVLGLLLDLQRGQRRMHNKLLVADTQFAIVGGRNVGDEYFQRRRGLEFGDLDLLVAGPVVPQLATGFDLYWNSPHVLPLQPAPAAAPDATPGAPGEPLPLVVTATDFARDFADGKLPLRRGRASAVQDDPRKVEGLAADLGQRIAAIAGADAPRDVLLVSPYFVPGTTGVEQLAALRRSGARVRVVTNSLAATDVPAVHAGYARYRRELLSAGVELYEFRADAPTFQDRRDGAASAGSSRVSLHAKLMVVDARVSFVGSMNIDPRSVRLNTENGIVVESGPLAVELAAGVEAALADRAWRVELQEGRLRWRGRSAGTEQVLEREPGASEWLRLKARLLSLFPLEQLL